MSLFDFTRLKRLMLIYRCVQFLLFILLVGVAFLFQTKYPGFFFVSFAAAIVVQGILLYPLYRMAWRDAGVEFDSSSTSLTADDLVALRKKRLLGDLWKVSILMFFMIFIYKAPDVNKLGTPVILSASLYVFLLIFLTYFQCFNYSAKKRMSEITK